MSGHAWGCQHTFSKPCLVSLILKDTHLVFSISLQASLCKQEFSKPCLINFISKHTHLVVSISRQASRCQQTFSKPCLLNLTSNDTHLVFSISRQDSRCEHAFSKPCLVNLISKSILYLAAAGLLLSLNSVAISLSLCFAFSSCLFALTYMPFESVSVLKSFKPAVSRTFRWSVCSLLNCFLCKYCGITI